jgi:hypothetical protein
MRKKERNEMRRAGVLSHQVENKLDCIESGSMRLRG